MKQFYALLMLCFVSMGAFAYDKATEGTTYYGSNCAAYGLADGTVAIYTYYPNDGDTIVVYPATIQVWDESGVMTAEYEVSAVGVSGWNNTYFGTVSSYQYNGTITTLAFSEGIKAINAGAFYEMTSLKYMTIPSTLTAIGDYAFTHCDALKRIDIASTNVSLGTDALRGSDNTSWDYIAQNCKVFIPNGTTANFAAYSFDNTQTWSYWDQFYANNNLIEAGQTTAISAPQTAEKAVSTARYNLQGMRVDGNYKGIIISNGKKYILR